MIARMQSSTTFPTMCLKFQIGKILAIMAVSLPHFFTPPEYTRGSLSSEATFLGGCINNKIRGQMAKQEMQR